MALVIDACIHVKDRHKTNSVLKELVNTLLTDLNLERRELQERKDKVDEKIKSLEELVKNTTDSVVLDFLRAIEKSLMIKQSKLHSEICGLSSFSCDCLMYMIGLDEYDEDDDEDEKCDCEREFPYL